jgi:hypothetical protein
MRSMNCLPFASTWVHPRFFSRVRVTHRFSFLCCPLCVFSFWVLCFDVRYDFRIKTMFFSSLPPVVCRRTRVSFTLCAHSGVQHICVVFLFCFFPVLLPVHFLMPLRYSLTFICHFCFSDFYHVIFMDAKSK